MEYAPEPPKREALESLRGRFRYDYPGGLDLTPGSELHDRLVSEVMVRSTEAHDVMSEKHDTWTELEKTMSAFVDLSEAEKRIKDKDPRKPLPLVLPVGFAMVETVMSFLVKAFLENPPLFPLAPVDGEDRYGTILLEMLLEHINQQKRNDLAVYRQLRDSQVYGFGVVAPRWHQEHGWVPKRPTMADQIRQFFNPSYRPPDEWTVLSEGCELVNIDPRLYWPDPSVPIDEPQRAEFLTWLESTTSLSLLGWEKESGGDIFNCRYVHEIDAKSRLGKGLDDISNVRSSGTERNLAPHSHPAHVVWCYINLVPRQWKLGESEYPEKWVFAVAGDSVLIQARPQGLRHNRFPVSVAAPDSNGRDVTPLSRLELVYGLQRWADWQVATMMEAQRIDVLGRWLVDPQVINMFDLQDASRRFIRARRSQWGKGKLTDALVNFSTSGLTANNMNNVAAITSLVKEHSGAVDGLQGIMSNGERHSAAEARGVFSGAMAKMERIAWMISRQAMRDTGYLMASQTQQLVSRDHMVRVTGNREFELRNEFGLRGQSVHAGPLDIQVPFDCIAQDASMPSGDHGETWMQLFTAVAADPELRQIFDIPRIFMHLSRTLGAKNVQQFIRDGGTIMPVIAPEGAVMDQVASGQLESLSNVA